MANKSSKGRQKTIKVKSKISPSGPKQGFARPTIVKAASATGEQVRRQTTNVPLTVCVVPFHASVFNADLVTFLHNFVITDKDEKSTTGMQILSGIVPGQPKKSLQLIVPNDRERIDLVLDAAKVADVLLCVFPNEASFEQSCFDELGYRTLTALRMQGLPSLVVGTVTQAHSNKTNIKTVQRYFVSEFATDKAKFVVPGVNVKAGDFESVARQVIGVMTAAPITPSVAKRSRGYMLIDSLVSSGMEVTISGFARGAGFGMKIPVHLTGCPDAFIVKRMEVLETGSGMDDVSRVIEATEEEIEALRAAAEPLRPEEEQEQTWPSAEEMMQRPVKRVIVPAGVSSDLEAAWLGVDEDMLIGADSLEMLNPIEEHLEAADVEAEVAVEDEDESLERGMFDWDTLGDQNTVEAEGRFEERGREDMDFVDEVDTPETSSARVRFQKYRGLKSLRSGNWDPYEELPAEFSQIVEFQDLAWAGRQVAADLASAEIKNRYVKLVLVPVSGVAADVSACGLVASTIAPFETKVTIVHCRVSRTAEALDVLIKNKDELVVQCGFRRFLVRPTFSDVPKYSASSGTAPMQRMHRQLPATGESTILMSFYAPAVFGSCPVLAFVGDQLALWGSVQSCAPNKPIVVKRATLTGYPFRVHQTKAVCRHMFFSPEDIDWFKPVELSTKKGLRGHIIESLGTHGYMKARFNGQLTSDDIVCMHLYKRVFPRFDSRAWASQTVQPLQSEDLHQME